MPDLVNRLHQLHSSVATVLELESRPARHWLIVYAVFMAYFFAFRCVALSAMLKMFGTSDERTSANRFYAIVLGSCEDFLLTTTLLVLLSLVDLVLGPRATTKCVLLRRSSRLLLHVLLVVLAVASFAADMLMIRSRELRFTFEFITTYIREFKFTAAVEVEPREIRIARETVAITVCVVITQLTITMLWLDLSRWHLAKLFVSCSTAKAIDDSDDEHVKVESGELVTDYESHSPTSQNSRTAEIARQCEQSARGGESVAVHSTRSSVWKRRLCNVCVPVVLLVTLATILLLITHAVPAVVSATALNCSLNEFSRTIFGLQFLKSLGDGSIESAALYLDTSTESYDLFKNDVLYRRTTGFKGPLAFDVAVNQSDLPNVVVIAVESFRHQDSLYIVGNASETIRRKQGNITLTPHFDRWAQRGVAFRNMWSSWQTSRSVEGILFGQVPYDHVSDSGTTTGRTKVKLSGMPQFFHDKGFETMFTTGARLDYDGWDKFFRPHGFDNIVGASEMRGYAELHYNISVNDWKEAIKGGQERSMYWGVHDDVSFEYLGDLLVNKSADQRARVRNGEAKTPIFINHYTISSHTPWDSTPTWFDDEPLPDFSALYEGRGSHTDDVRRYAKLRYFTDAMLGKFLDRIQRSGVLDDTIVVIVGDHGQSPETRMTRVYADETTTTRVAGTLIAEGRLGKYAGLAVDDAVHHYDLLNTLADIIGVPEAGFLQSGVGRSLKRTVRFGSRPVWSNNPMRRMAVVKGHARLSYDRVFDHLGLYDVETDPMERQDLLPTVNDSARREWETLREHGRRLSRYFRVRWEKQCISQVTC